MGLFTLQYCCVSSSYIGLGVVPGYRSFFHENEWNYFTEKLYSEEVEGRFSPEILQDETEPREFIPTHVAVNMR